jgi:hypothetical protein
MRLVAPSVHCLKANPDAHRAAAAADENNGPDKPGAL